MGIMRDGNQVGIRIITDGMNTWHLTTADMVNTQQLRVGGVFCPCLLTVYLLYNLFCQRNCRSTGMVELMHMMRLLHLHIILWELVHDLCQITVYCRENSHTDTEVRSPEQGLTSFRTHLTDILSMFLHPSCRTTHHLHVVLEGTLVVSVGCLRGSKLNGDICRSKSGRIKVLLIVYVNNTHNFMTTVKGNLFYHLTHLAITYQCYFHPFIL